MFQWNWTFECPLLNCIQALNCGSVPFKVEMWVRMYLEIWMGVRQLSIPIMQTAAKYSRRNLLFQGLPYPSWIISIFQTLLIAKELPVESLTCINVLLFWSSLAMFSLRKDDIHNQCMEMMPHHCAIVLLNSTILFCVIKRHSGNGAW